MPRNGLQWKTSQIDMFNSILDQLRRAFAPRLQAKQDPKPSILGFPKQLNLDLAQKVLVFAPHPDDEIIGCGGTLARLAKQVPVKVVLVTNGDGGPDSPDKGMGPLRVEEMKRAVQLIGITDLECMHYPDGAFQPDAAFTSRIQSLVQGFQPNWVFLPSSDDYHPDHVLVSESIAEAIQNASSVRALLFYEIWAPVLASHVVDITEVMSLKLAALNQHQTALKYGDYARAVEGLNAYRGLYLGLNKYAEAFKVQEQNNAP